ncbi:glycosyltransferase [Fusobacterium sp.]|uniref:glycosyltransferase n=1 Tax=Fusobacterium sp. TaxID=68766 RepID=UPI0025B833BE|nr:glycosyltransferase [Fusobacterium sp.]
MKIIIVIPTLGNGGAERVATILANSFFQNNQVSIFLMESSSIEKYEVDRNIAIFEAGIKTAKRSKLEKIYNYIYNYKRQRKLLKKTIKETTPDIIISFLPKADFLVFSIKKSFKWIVSERNDPVRRNFLEKLILNIIYKKSDMLICQTKKVSTWYKNKGIKKTCIIKNPIIIQKKSRKEYTEKKFLISIGRLDKQKNFKMLIEAFFKAKQQKNIKEKLYIIGEGPQRKELEYEIRKKNMQSEIKLLGRKKNTRYYLENAKAFILSSDYEGLPNVMLEAMDAELPIISTNFFSGAATELIDEKNGIIVPVGKIDKMTEAICKIVSKEMAGSLKKMGEVSKKRVRQMDCRIICYQWEKMLKNILKGGY